MEPIVATYLVKITLREPSDRSEPAPLVRELVQIIEETLTDIGWAANVTAERTDE